MQKKATSVSEGSLEKHNKLVSEIILKYGRGDCRLWRNETGKAIKLSSFFAFKKLNDTRILERGVFAYGLKGSPDIIGIYKGRFIGIEVKTGNAKQSPIQKNFERMVLKLGGIYILAREIEDVKKGIGK
jgi:hypothetical protein